MKNVIILLSIILFLFVAGVGNAGNGKKEAANYKLYYDNNGDILYAELTSAGISSKCELTQGPDKVNDKFLKELYKKHEIAEPLGNNAIKFSGSPDCIVYIGGWPVCVCCPQFKLIQ